jgi:hypothetical protein
MKPSELKKLIESRFKAGIKRPVLIEGSPGIGKTELAGQVAASLGIGFKVIHAPLLQPEDYAMPVVSADKSDVKFIVSRDKFPLEGTDCPEKGLLLIDELPQCDNNSQKILTNFIHTGEIHGQRIKPGWVIIATGNRVTDRAGANRILSHLGNRVTRVGLDVSLDDWTNWALNNGVQVEVISFIRFRPAMLNEFNAQVDINPTPRAWAQGVSAALGAIDPGQEFEVFTGDVGEGAAAEFCGFLKIYRKLPNVDTILLNPSKADVPTEPATLYALCGALAARTSKDNFGRVMEYVGRILPEFQSLFVRDTVVCRTSKKGKDCNCKACQIATTAEFIKWASGPGAKLLT